MLEFDIDTETSFNICVQYSVEKIRFNPSQCYVLFLFRLEVRMTTIDVGTPPLISQDWEVFKFNFHNFKRLHSRKGKGVSTSSFSRFNHTWELQLYPGGNTKATYDSKDGMMSLYLNHRLKGAIAIDFDILIKDTAGNFFERGQAGAQNFDGTVGLNGWGFKDFVEYSKIVDSSNNILNHGTLTVELPMKSDAGKHCLNFIPKNPSPNMLKMLNDEEASDVSFEVRGGKVISANRIVLKHYAPMLASLCETYDKSNPLPIPDVDPETFGYLLRYVYGGSTETFDWEKDSKAFIDATDKYGIVNLKLEAEARHDMDKLLRHDKIVQPKHTFE